MLSRLSYLNKALLFTFGLKILYLLLGNAFPNGWHGWDRLFEVMARNDSGWYFQIAADWYPSHPPAPGEQTAFPFFPLYPLLLGLVMKLTGTYIAAATLLHIALSWIWVKVLFGYLRLKGFDDRKAMMFTVLLQCFPWAYFFHVYYSEILFSTLLLWSLSALMREKPLQLMMAVFLLALCRPTGVVMAAGMVFFVLEKAGWLAILKDRKSILLALSLAGAPLAVLAWSGYLYNHCGDPLAFSHSQAAWGRAYTWPWESFFTNGFWDVQFLSAVVLIMLLITVYIMRKAGTADKLFVGLNLLFPLTTGAVTSYYRFFLVIPQVFEYLFGYFYKRWIPVAIILLSLNLLTFYYWVSHSGWLSF